MKDAACGGVDVRDKGASGASTVTADDAFFDCALEPEVADGLFDDEAIDLRIGAFDDEGVAGRGSRGVDAGEPDQPQDEARLLGRAAKLPNRDVDGNATGAAEPRQALSDGRRVSRDSRPQRRLMDETAILRRRELPRPLKRTVACC